VNIEGRKVLVLGGYGLVGQAVCRELLLRRPREIQIHSLREEESHQAREELAAEAGSCQLTASWGDIFGLTAETTSRERILAQLGAKNGAEPTRFLLYQLLQGGRPDIVVDCVNTATGIAYRDIFGAAEAVCGELSRHELGEEGVERLLEALYVPRLIRHVQVLYRGMLDAGTGAYVKVGTTGTGGMGLNIPYTHSEERPSRVLLAKTAIAGAQSMLLFAMARTPGGPLVKEIKPAAAIAWKRIGCGPIHRRRRPIRLVDAQPQPLGATFSSHDPQAAPLREEVLESAFIDTGENGIFSLEEFITVTSSGQMEFVTPEEIARYLVFELEGGNTGRDIVAALDGAVLGPTYRAGLLRQAAIEHMEELERESGVRSVAFEMLGPPRVSKLLFEAHLLREALGTISAVLEAGAEGLRDGLDRYVREHPEEADRIAAVGLPVLLDSGEALRGPEVLIPPDADRVEVTPERLERWVRDGWVDLRLANCHTWIERFRAIDCEVRSRPVTDTSSRHSRDRRFWEREDRIRPGKVVGWILSVEEKGHRFKR
jgi:NAD(P)-dependent dehydrogenase (short-subunit alcohol dehydrogenase family)